MLGSIGTLPAGKPAAGSAGAPVGAEKPMLGSTGAPPAVGSTGAPAGAEKPMLGSTGAPPAVGSTGAPAGAEKPMLGSTGAPPAVGSTGAPVGAGVSGKAGKPPGVASGVVGMMGVGSGVVGPVAMVGSWNWGVAVGSETGCVGSLLMVVGNPGFPPPNKGFVGLSIGTADPRSRPQPFVMSDQT